MTSIKQFYPISGEAYVKYSQGPANKIATINLGLKSKIANEFLTELWGLPKGAGLQESALTLFLDQNPTPYD